MDMEHWMPLYAVNLFDLQKGDEEWVARLWNVSEERVINAQVKFTTTPFNARSSRFQGVPPRNLRFDKVNGIEYHWLASEWLIVRRSSSIDSTTSLLERAEVKSFDTDYNSQFGRQPNSKQGQNNFVTDCVSNSGSENRNVTMEYIFAVDHP